jgi:hypothetical protein
MPIVRNRITDYWAHVLAVLVMLVGCTHSQRYRVFEPSVAPRSGAVGGYVISVKLPDWADPVVPWESSYAPLTCVSKSTTLTAILAPEVKNWPYVWPEKISCGQGSKAISFKVQPIQPGAAMWLAADGTVVFPTRGDHVSFMQRVSTPNVVSAKPGAGPVAFACDIKDTDSQGTVFSFSAEVGSRSGVFTCNLTQTDGVTVSQQVAVVHYEWD